VDAGRRADSTTAVLMYDNVVVDHDRLPSLPARHRRPMREEHSRTRRASRAEKSHMRAVAEVSGVDISHGKARLENRDTHGAALPGPGHRPAGEQPLDACELSGFLEWESFAKLICDRARA